MKNLLLALLTVIGSISTTNGQFIYKIKADSVLGNPLDAWWQYPKP